MGAAGADPGESQLDPFGDACRVERASGIDDHHGHADRGLLDLPPVRCDVVQCRMDDVRVNPDRAACGVEHPERGFGPAFDRGQQPIRRSAVARVPQLRVTRWGLAGSLCRSGA